MVPIVSLANKLTKEEREKRKRVSEEKGSERGGKREREKFHSRERNVTKNWLKF